MNTRTFNRCNRSYKISFIVQRLMMISFGVLFFNSSILGQIPGDLFPDLSYFKLQMPLDDAENDYEGVAWEDRDNPHVKNESFESLETYVPQAPYDYYFFAEDGELVFRAHCAGALTSPNAYPRCELREQINGEDSFWDYSDEHELNVTLRITELPDEKQEVCVVQLKATNTPETTSGTDEVLRVEYRQDGSSGWHLTINEASGPSNVLDYTLGETVHIRTYVNNDHVTLEMENLDTGDTYTTDYASDYTHGYFKAGAYTQSSIWEEKNGVADELPDAHSEVRFSELSLSVTDSGGDSGVCVPDVPSNRSVGNVGSNYAELDWDDVPNIDHYNVRYRELGTTEWNFQYSLQESQVTLGDLMFETEYEWQVRAKCPDGSGSDYSDGQGPDFLTDLEGEDNNDICVPTIPANRQVTDIGITTADLDWDDVPNFDHYNVRYRPLGTSDWSFQYSLQESQVTLDDLAPETEYEWQVRAKCPDGSGSNYNDGQGPDFTTDPQCPDPEDEIALAVVINPNVIGSSNDIISLFFVAANTGTSNSYELMDISTEVSLFTGQATGIDLELNLIGDVNGNDLLDPGENWIFTSAKSFTYNPGETFVVATGMEFVGPCGQLVLGAGNLLFTYTP